MRVIGLTGSLGTGKTTVASMFSDLGVKILNADKITHQLLNPSGACFKPVVKMFGSDILTRGKIDRKKIAECVFNDPKQLRELEKIIHPEVRKVILANIKKFKKSRRSTVVVIDVPLLFETKLNRDVDITVVVKASRAAQILRATKLLGITKAEARRRIKAQMPLRKKIRLADIIIDNNRTLKKTKKQVEQIWEKL